MRLRLDFPAGKASTPLGVAPVVPETGSPLQPEFLASTLHSRYYTFTRRGIRSRLRFSRWSMPTSTRTRTLVLAAAAVLLLSAPVAISSKLAFTWKNNHYSGSGFKNILVIAMNGRASSRADFEDRVVKELSRPGVVVVPSYSLMPRPDATPIDPTDIRGYVHDLKFDAIIISRITKLQKHTYEVQGDDFPFFPYYATFYGYYTTLAPIVYSPSYLQTDVDLQVETNLYATTAPDGTIVWTGTTDTFDPSSASSAINSIVKILVKQFQKDKLI